MLKIGWFSTARGESSRKLLESIVSSINEGSLKASIEFVYCSREPGESGNTDVFLKQVNGYGIPLVTLSVKQFAERHKEKISVSETRLPEWRLEYDRNVIEKLKDFKVDICILAGYMLIVGPEMCYIYNMINLHPALPTGPKGTWQEVIWSLIEGRAAESGVMMHLVTPDLDRGPVISYCRYSIVGPEFDVLWKTLGNAPASEIKLEQGENTELFKAIRKAGFIREIPLIIHTLKAFSQGKIMIGDDKKLHDGSRQVIQGYDLTGEINAAISKQTLE